MFKIIRYQIVLLCPFLFSIFPILFIYQNNIIDVNSSQLILPMLIVTATNLLLILVLRKFYEKEVVAIILIGFWFSIFYYLYFFKLIQFVFTPTIIRKSYIIFSWFVGIFLCLRLLINKKFVLLKIIHVFSYFLTFLIIISLFKIFKEQNKLNLPIYNTSKAEYSLIDKKKEKYSDIYCLILDGYPNNKVLVNKFSFNDSFFINSLLKNKFHVFLNSRSNYTLTFLSMASLLNMEYINNLLSKRNISGLDRRPAYDLISDNKVVSFLKEKKYKIINISSGWGATDILESANVNLKYNKYASNFMSVLINKTIIQEILNNLKININPDFVNVSYSLEELPKIKKIKGPKFVLAHILSPHDSYVFNSDGTAAVNFDREELLNKKKYINSLNVLNRKVLKVVNSLLSDSINSPIIIIQSDHGSSSSFIPKIEKWRNPNRQNIDERLSNFAAYYLPGKLDYLQDTISSVNTFRIIFNKYFNTKLKLLPNKMYFSNYDEPYKFTEFRE